VYKEQLSANKSREIQVIAEQAGVSWNFDGQQLLWVSLLYLLEQLQMYLKSL
jgi:hypothetical protein